MYKVKVAKFDSIEKRDLSVRYNYDESSIDNIIAIKYKNIFIDIETGLLYEELKRDKNNLLKKQNVELNRMYAVSSELINSYSLIDYLNVLKTKLITVNKIKKLSR